MILIAPDKFKGTLSAREATDIIASAIGRDDVIKAPMADGGEGTSAIIAGCNRLVMPDGVCVDSCRWDARNGYYVERHSRTAVIDSSAVIGLQLVPPSRRNVLKASSMPLGVKVREILKGGCTRVIIGVGGTATCDGGLGFLEALDIERIASYSDKLIGLCDVQVPLVAPPGKPSALMFAPQKGAAEVDMMVLERRLEQVKLSFGEKSSPYDGAGGGLGFALASAIGAHCYSGAEYVLRCHDIDWRRVSMVITGEGCIDRQTLQGKVVQVVTTAAKSRGIPVVAFGGIVNDNMKGPDVISTSDYFKDLELSHRTAALRLEAAVRDYFASR